MRANAQKIDYQILIEGDRGLTVEFGQSGDSTAEKRGRALAALLEEEKLPGIQAILPNGGLLTVIYDPLVLTYGKLSRRLSSLIRTLVPEGAADGAEKEEPSS